jgi:multidrug efflux pump subunit AcrB
VPLRVGTERTTYLRDVAKVLDSTDIPTGYALVNGKRTVYIPITKRADASTLAVVDEVKENIPRFQAVLPDDIKVSYEFDQSGYVRRAIDSLFFEALMGALLTGVMVFLFLRDWRSVLIVILNIPLALLSSVLCLWICGQTVNIMTLGGLALAVGILVDETTVTIENIHAHLARGVAVPRAALGATNEILKPALLTLLCVLSVFLPSFFMEGVAHALFVPLTLAVGFSMIGSFILSRTLVPVLSAWLLKEHHPSEGENHGSFRGFRIFMEEYLGDC